MSQLVPPSQQRATRSSSRQGSAEQPESPGSDYQHELDRPGTLPNTSEAGVLNETDEEPEPNHEPVPETLVKEWQMLQLFNYIRVMTLAEFKTRTKGSADYVGHANTGAHGRLRCGRTRAVHEDQCWARSGTRPATITIEESSENPSMRRKKAIEGGREYACNVFTNAQQPRTWTIGVCHPAADADGDKTLRAALQSASTRVKPGRLSDRHDDHDLLRAIGEDPSLKYNTVPDVTVLDTLKTKYYYVNWHLAHELSQSTWWEVGFFFRQYTCNVSRKIGDALVLESLVAHGKAPGSDMVSPIPKKRKVDHFAMDDSAGASSSKRTV
ncbi:hypothetical protein CF326_g6279 [Tilletia indica]|nr:hypothetical protein CF326_g6279 [Tilletia indica]